MKLSEIESKVIAVKSITGTGKTTAIAEIVNALPDDSRVLVLSHRVPLVAQWLGDLGGFQSYSESSKQVNIRTMPRLICSYDSAHKLRGSTYDYVIADEPDQAFPHALLGQTSIRNVRRQMAEVLKSLFYSASKVFLTSAHLTDLEVNMVTTLAETQSITAIENLKKPEPRVYVRYSHRKETEEALFRMLLKDERCFVASDSASEARQIADRLIKAFPDKKLLVVTKDTNDKEAMHNANEYLKGYDCVVASPTMGTGVNISDPDLFHYVFGFFVNNRDPIGYLDLVQAVNRVRTPIAKEYHVYVSQLSAGQGYTREELAQRERVNENNMEQWITVSKDGTFAPIAEGKELYGHVQEWQSQYLWRQQQESRQRYAKFWLHVKNLGHSVTKVEHSNDGLEEYEAGRKETLEAINLSDFEAVVAAKDLSKQEAKELLKTRVKTREQKLALEKFTVKERLKLDDITVDDVAYYRADGHKLSTILWLSNMTADEAIAKDTWTIAQYSYDRTRYQEQRFIVLELMKQVEAVVNGHPDRFTIAQLPNWLEWQRANVEGLRSLGIKVNLERPATALIETLKLMEYTVESTKRKVPLTPSSSSIISSEPKVNGTKRKAATEWVYDYYRTQEQKDTWNRLVSVHSAPGSLELLTEFLSTQTTAFTFEHINRYLGESSLLPDALARELEQRGYVTYDGQLWRKPIVLEEEAIEEVTIH